MTPLATCGRSSACKTASLRPPEAGTDWPERESGVLLRAGRQAELIGRQGRSSDTAGRCHSGRRGRLLGRLRHGGQTIHKRLPLLIAIPTTAGTGSETTLAAVITDAQTRYKYAINDFPLIPRYAVLDPKVTLSLPPAITASTGMDALTHAVEAFIGNSTTYGTRKDALLAVKLIFENLDIVYNDGSNLDARRNMLHASFYAGCAFTKSYVGYVHAVAHSLGGQYNVPHGYANAVILPMVLEAYGSAVYKKLDKLAVEAGIAAPEDSYEEGAKKFIQAIKDMKLRFHIGNTIPEIREEDIPKLAHYADKEANPLYPVPVLMNARELENFYYGLMEIVPDPQ